MRSNTKGDADLQPSIITAPSLYPTPSEAALHLQYAGKHIKDIQAPAAIIDAAVVRRNCNLMLEAVRNIGLGFRAHVKTHKTTQITKLQVGADSRSVKLICSTVSEVENLLPWLVECKAQGKEINVLYGLPILPSAIPRLSAIARILGEGTIGVFTDHPAHIQTLDKVENAAWPGRIPIWVNIDVGGQREGVPAGSKQLADLAKAIAASQRVHLVGLYTYMGASYASNSPEEALTYMSKELEGVREGALSFVKSTGERGSDDSNATKVTLSFGTTPTATSMQNLLENTEGAKKYRTMLEDIGQSFELELHAGVFPVNDMQQLATRARPEHAASNPDKSLLSYSNIGFRILTEVASVYPDRTETPEALVATGSIALGREPCKSYSGWGVVSPWPAKSGDHYDPEGSRTGWIVGRISQEHGMLTWEGPRDHIRQLQLGEKLLLWPNHACIAGVNFGWYLVVDSDSDDPDRIQDVWMRWRGW